MVTGNQMHTLAVSPQWNSRLLQFLHRLKSHTVTFNVGF
jgi:hypothetical protein